MGLCYQETHFRLFNLIVASNFLKIVVEVRTSRLKCFKILGLGKQEFALCNIISFKTVKFCRI